MFFKERLERFVWLITDETNSGAPSFSSGRCDSSDDESKKKKVEFERDLVKMSESGKIVFASREKFYDYVRNEIESNKKNFDSNSKTINFEFKGAIVLPLEKFDSESMISIGLDWSYAKLAAGSTSNKSRTDFD